MFENTVNIYLLRVLCLRLHVHARIHLDFLKARFWFLLVRWSVGKRTFLACSTLFLTGQFIFSGRGCVVVGMHPIRKRSIL